MESILRQISSEEAWEGFLAHRLRKGRLNWHAFEEADAYVEEKRYQGMALRMAEGEAPGIPTCAVINKMGTGKKRTVYFFPEDEMRQLKLMAYLLYRYDDIFAPNCYAFRRGIRACDAIRRLNRELHGKSMWAYKVDIHDYFNSISIPILLPMLKEVFKDDPALYAFFERLLDDDRAMMGNEIIHGSRGVMAGLPVSSFLADVYLSEVDHYFFSAGILYARYSDDIIIFAPDKQTLMGYRDTLLSFFGRFRLTVNPAKERVYSPDEPFEFLGFRCHGAEVDISRATRDKLKGKIRRKARSLRRWSIKNGKTPQQAVQALIRSMNRKLFEGDQEQSLCWSRWFFPVINRTDGLKEIDHYFQQACRYVMTGRHNKANYRIRYEDLKALGYRSLVHEFYASQMLHNAL